MFRPRRTTVVAIAAEPIEKPDARLLGVKTPILHATGKSIGFTELSDKSRNYDRDHGAIFGYEGNWAGANTSLLAEREEKRDRDYNLLGL